MFDFHLPDWLYEALPHVYLIAGIASIAKLGSTLSVVSGGVLICAGVYTWQMRRTHRKKQKRSESDHSRTLRAKMARITFQRREVERKEAELRRS
jgi:hypothetical protein